MQKLAAYLLEQRTDVAAPHAIASGTDAVRSTVDAWLSSKGATGFGTGGSRTGTFTAQDGRAAKIQVDEALDGQRRWWMVRLDELNDVGRRFVTSLSVTTTTNSVAVYVTLEAGSETTGVNLVDVDARCPKVVRSILQLPGAWFHGASELKAAQRVVGFDEGLKVANAIADGARTVPLVALSYDEQGPALPDLDTGVAHDLVGLANVLWLDAEATWALTDCLGQRFSCYNGAVRLYWPKLSATEDPLRHPRWTAQRLRSVAVDPVATRGRLRRELRARVMRASALSAVRPPEIDQIRTASMNRAFASLKEQANSLQGVQDLAQAFEEENAKLHELNGELRNNIDELQFRIAELEAERDALLTRVDNAEARLAYASRSEGGIAPEPPTSTPGVAAEATAPAPGETRFYKKLYPAPTHDVMTRVADCGHSSWQSGHAGEKAKKGIAKIEGRSEWRTIQHCGTCTGGGLWKVRW